MDSSTPAETADEQVHVERTTTGDLVSAGDISLSEATAHDIHAQGSVTLRESSAAQITALEAHVTQSATARLSAETAHVTQSAMGFAQVGMLALAGNSSAGAVLSHNSVHVSHSPIGVLLARGSAEIVQGSVGALVTGQARVHGGRVGFLIAREVHGDVRPVLDARGAAVFGALMGLAVGVVWLFRRHLR